MTSTPSKPQRAARRARGAWAGRNAHRAAGLSIVELLIALIISALLLTAITVALNATFHAYATAAETAGTQSSARLIMQRLLSMIRTSTLHDAYDPDDPAKTLGPPAAAPVVSVGIQMIDGNGQLLRVWWELNTAYSDPDLGDLFYSIGGTDPQPLLERVRVQRDAGTTEPFLFTLESRDGETGLLLSRATVDLTAEPGADATLALESVRGASAPVRLVASTIPRRNIQ